MSQVYFCDRNLGKRFGLELRRLGLSVELHDEHFPQNTPDEDLLRQVSAQSWVILTLDKRMRYRKAEREAILSSGAGVLMLPMPKNPERGWLSALAQEFFHAQDKVQGFLQRTPRPFLARLYIDPQKRGQSRYQVREIPLR